MRKILPTGIRNMMFGKMMNGVTLKSLQNPIGETFYASGLDVTNIPFTFEETKHILQLSDQGVVVNGVDITADLPDQYALKGNNIGITFREDRVYFSGSDITEQVMAALKQKSSIVTPG